MSDNRRSRESMLFNHETTMRSDFRPVAVKDVQRTVYKEKPMCLRIRPPPLKDIHTLTDWKTPYVPIDLLVKPKDIVHTNPRKMQERYEPLEDVEKDYYRATRPRLVMTPAVSMDDIDDKQIRNLLIRDTYASSAKRGMASGIVSVLDQSQRAPLIGTYSATRPILLPSARPSLVSPEWRMESVSWDDKQLRGFCDPKKDFWLNRKEPKCSACTQSAAVGAHRKMLRQMKN